MLDWLRDYYCGMETANLRSCLDCTFRPDRLFCDLPDDALQAFDSIKSLNDCPRGTILFEEGHPARGIFVLCEGRVRLSVCSEAGRRLTLRMVGPGEVLGLSAALAGSVHESTAETLENSRVATVRRKELLKFLHQHREACLQVVQQLSENLHLAYDRVRSIGLGRTRRSRTTRPQLH